MQCILIGVSPPCPEAWKIVNEHLVEYDDYVINWISNSKATYEGQSVDLLCAVTEAPLVDDIVSATAHVISDNTSTCHICELWASSPAILTLRPIEGYDKYITVAEKQSNENVERTVMMTMKEWGIYHQTALLDTREVNELKHYINDEISCIEELISLHRPDITIGKDILAFQEISSRGNERFDLLLSSPICKVRDFVNCTLLKRISPLIERILNGQLGHNIDFDISVVFSKPGAPNQGWHADGEHQSGATDAGWDAKGWLTQLAEPYAICFFIPLIDLDDKTGYTQFWPASHRNRGLPGFGPVAKITQSTWDGKCRAGDMVVYDYRLMHRGMANTSNVVRPILQILFKKTWYKERRNYGIESLCGK